MKIPLDTISIRLIEVFYKSNRYYKIKREWRKNLLKKRETINY